MVESKEITPVRHRLDAGVGGEAVTVKVQVQQLEVGGELPQVELQRREDGDFDFGGGLGGQAVLVWTDTQVYRLFAQFAGGNTGRGW